MSDYLGGGEGFAFAGATGGMPTDRLALASEVLKAITMDGTLPRATGSGFDPLGVEDLTGTMKSAETRKEQLVLWTDCPKVDAWSLVVEGGRLDNLNTGGLMNFYGDGDAGFVSDETYARVQKNVRYQFVLAQVGRPALDARMLGQNGVGQVAMQNSEMAHMLMLLRSADLGLVFGDSTVMGLEWDGYCKQIDDASTSELPTILDMKGATPDKKLLNNIMTLTTNNSAAINKFYVDNFVMRDLLESMFPEQRTGENVREGAVGYWFDRWLGMTLSGQPSETFIRRAHMMTPGVRGAFPRFAPTLAKGAQAPQAPVSVVATPGSNTNVQNWRPGLVAGTYYYTVVAVGKGGYSVGTSSAAAGPTAGQANSLAITQNDASADMFWIFRNIKGTEGSDVGVRQFMGRVARSTTSSVTTWVDDGLWVPGTGTALGMEIANDEVTFQQLRKPYKLPLPRVAMAENYAIIHAGCPFLVVPTHDYHIRNIGGYAQTGMVATTA